MLLYILLQSKAAIAATKDPISTILSFIVLLCLCVGPYVYYWLSDGTTSMIRYIRKAKRMGIISGYEADSLIESLKQERKKDFKDAIKANLLAILLYPIAFLLLFILCLLIFPNNTGVSLVIFIVLWIVYVVLLQKHMGKEK